MGQSYFSTPYRIELGTSNPLPKQRFDTEFQEVCVAMYEAEWHHEWHKWFQYTALPWWTLLTWLPTMIFWVIGNSRFYGGLSMLFGSFSTVVMLFAAPRLRHNAYIAQRGIVRYQHLCSEMARAAFDIKDSPAEDQVWEETLEKMPHLDIHIQEEEALFGTFEIRERAIRRFQDHWQTDLSLAYDEISNVTTY
jgi:hypothetical protein